MNTDTVVRRNKNSQSGIEKSPAHQHYPRDFYSETATMTAEQAGAYIWLRGRCWELGSIPSEISKLARICKLSSKKMSRAWEAMRHLFVPVADGYMHPGMEAERAKQAEWRAKSSIGGIRSGESRRKKVEPKDEPPFNHPSTTVEPPYEPNANQSPTTTPTKREPNTNIAVCSLQFAEEIPPVVPQGGPSQGSLLDAETAADPPSTVRPAVRAKKKKTPPAMSARQRERFNEFLGAHPKNTVQTASSEKIWTEKVKTDELANWLITTLREECTGDTKYLFGPGKWLADHLVLYASGVAPEMRPPISRPPLIPIVKL